VSVPAVKGWCPSALTPMESGDGHLVRIKPRAATLTTGQVRAIAGAAEVFGNGLIDLTNRGNLQIRGLTPATLDDFSPWVQESGLASPTPAAEAIRNVLADPLGLDWPGAMLDSHALAQQIAASLESAADLYALPDKVGVLVDGGGPLGLADATTDVMVRASGDACQIQLAGGQSGRQVADTDAAPAVLRILRLLLDWIEAAGPEEADTRRRMKQMVRSVGEDGIFDAAAVEGAVVPVADRAAAPPQDLFGFHPLGDDQGYLGIGAPFGSLQADDLRFLADLADDHGNGALRITPWKAVVLACVPVESEAAMTGAVERQGLIVGANDGRRWLVACTGAPGCTSGLSPIRADADHFLQGVAYDERMVHLSGCAKGCAHPRPAAWTAVATGPGQFDLIRNGTASDPPVRREVATTDLAATIADLEGAPARPAEAAA